MCIRDRDVIDTHAAIEYAISKGYDEIELYGVTGGRLEMCIRDSMYTFTKSQSKTFTTN